MAKWLTRSAATRVFVGSIPTPHLKKMEMIKPKKEFMLAAISQANFAREKGDYAIGAVIVKDDKIYSVGYNQSKISQNPIFHAEIVAIMNATKIANNRHLEDCILYTTHEPCPMCAGASVFAKLRGIVYGARFEDMRNYRLSNSNGDYLWRTVDISCEEVIRKSAENIEIVKEFMREECLTLFHS